MRFYVQEVRTSSRSFKRGRMTIEDLHSVEEEYIYFICCYYSKANNKSQLHTM